jgi:hypothetical protein
MRMSAKVSRFIRIILSHVSCWEGAKDHTGPIIECGRTATKIRSSNTTRQVAEERFAPVAVCSASTSIPIAEMIAMADHRRYFPHVNPPIRRTGRYLLRTPSAGNLASPSLPAGGASMTVEAELDRTAVQENRHERSLLTAFCSCAVGGGLLRMPKLLR